jgi:polyferredoxin
MKNKIRLIFQLVFLGLVGYVAVRPLLDSSYVSDFEAYCPFGGISSFFSMLNQATMACNMSEVQYVLGLGLVAGVILAGKLFCSYVCPIGAVTEWLGKLGQKLKVRIEMPRLVDRPLRLLKYALLFVTLYFTMTSSELFCKEFDPYFASVNLLDNTDITLYFAVPALALTILGAVFFRLFWCKYLCPLNALSNIFLNVAASGAIIIIFIIANLLGAGLSYVYLVAGLVLAGAANELGFMKSFILPAPKITRDTGKCSDCGLCDKKCPQGIKISEMPVVNHVDCTLCTDCVYTCPLKNTLSVNKKKNFKYLAPVTTIILIAVSLGIAANFELTTISERWGDYNKATETYYQTGLKNIKCFGSSMTLKGTLEAVHGIYGLDTYAKSHSVRIYYNPAEISEKKVKKSLFTPTKMEIKKFKPGQIDSLSLIEVGILGLFDLYDFNNLFYTLREADGVYGFATHYGEPVMATIYYDAKTIKPAAILKQIEKEKIRVKKPTGTVEDIELQFEVEGSTKMLGKISVPEYKKAIFREYDRIFNKYDTYKPEQLSVFIFPMPEAAILVYRRYFGQLTSHLSADNGIVRLSTRFTKVPSGYIFFDPSQVSVERIKEQLTKPKLTIFLNDTETKEVENPFHIKAEGEVKKAIETDIDEEEL